MAVKVLEVHLVGDGVSLDRALTGSAKTATAAATTMEAAGTRMVAAGKRISSTGKSMTRGLTLPLVAVGALAIKTAFDFEKSMSLIATEAGGTRKEVNHLEKSVLSLARASQWSPNQLATGLYHIESSGYRGAKAMDILNVSQKLATAGNSELEETTYALVSAVRALGTEGIGPTNKVAAELNAIIGHGDMRLQELVQALSSGVIPTAVTAGMGLRDVGAALDIMTSRGEPAQMAATRLRMTISLLSAPTDKAKDALKEIGIASLDLAKIMRKEGIGPAVAFLAEHLERVSKLKANVILSAAFGGGRSSGAIKTLVLNAEELIEKEKDIGKGVHNYSREVREAENRNMTKMKEAWSSIQADLVEIGKTIGPPVLKVFQEISGTISSLTKSFTKLDKGTQGWIIKGVAALAIGGPLLLGVGKLITGWGKLVILFGKAAKALELVTAAETAAAAVGTAGIATGVAATGAAGAAEAGGLLGPRGTPIYEELGIAGASGGAGAAGVGAGELAGAGGAGGLLGGMFKSSGGIKGAARMLGRSVLAAAGGYIVAELGVHGLKAMGVGDPTEGQGIAKSLTHGFNTDNVASTEHRALRQAEGFNPKVSDAGIKKLRKTFKSTIGLMENDSILGLAGINSSFRKGLNLTDAIWARNTPQWRKHTLQAMHGAIDAIREGMESGSVDAKEGQAEINQILRRIKFTEGKDPIGIADAMAKSFKEAGGITQKGIRQWVNQLGLMPKGAREAASDATLGMLREWARGHPKIEAQVQQLTNYQVKKFGATNKQLREGVKKGATGPVAQSFDELAKGVAGSLGNIGRNTQEVLKVLGVSDISSFKIINSVGGKFTGPGEKQGPGHTHRAEGGPIGHIVPGTGVGDIVDAALPPESFVLNKKANEHFFARGGHVPVKIEPKERVFLPAEVKSLGLNNLEAMNKRVPRFAAGGSIPHPQISGGFPTGDVIGQASIDLVYKSALKVLDAARAKIAAAGPGGKTAYGPKGIGSYMGVPMANWVIQALQYGAAHGSGNPQPTSGYRSHAQNVSEGRTYTSEHEFTQYPGGAVDFGGMVDPSALGPKMAVVRSTAGFKYPLLAPAGFRDDGHASGTGHMLGGLIQALSDGGVVNSVGSVLMRNGLDAVSAAGILGNAFGESEWNPGAIGSGGGGLWGFTTSPISLSDMQNYAASQHTPWTDPETQTQFLLHHLESSLKSKMNASDSTDDTTSIFMHEWERPENYSSLGKRQSAAGRALKMLGGKDAGGSKAENVPALFDGCQTKSLSFPPVPKTLARTQSEIDKWRPEVGRYKKAAKKAADKHMTKTAHALTANAKNIENYLRQLWDARKKLKIEKAKKHISKRMAKSLARITGKENLITEGQRSLEEAEEYAGHVVELEPTAPILPDTATDKEREDAEKAFEARYKGYVDQNERSAYQNVLGVAGNLRETILGAEHFATGLENNWEKLIRTTDHDIDHTHWYIGKVGGDIEDWKKQYKKQWLTDHPKAKSFPGWPPQGQWPKWLQGEIKEREHLKDQLPVQIYRDQVTRTTLGEGRESFYSDRKDPVGPGKGVGGDFAKNSTIPPIPMVGSGSFEDALTSLQGVHRWPALHQPMKPLPVTPDPAGLGGQIWDTQMAIRELGLKIAETGSSGGGGDENTDAEKLRLTEELLAQERRGKASLEATREVMSNLGSIGPKDLKNTYPWAGRYAKGGMVAALFGETGPEIGITPEGTNVATASQTEALLTPHVEVNNHHYPDHTETEVLINGKKSEAIVNHVAAELGARANHRAQGVSDGTTGTL